MLPDLGLGVRIEVVDRASGPISSIISSFTRLETEAQRATGIVDGFMASMMKLDAIQNAGEAIGRVGDSIMKAGESITKTLYDMGKKAVETGSRFENYRVTLQALYKDNKALSEQKLQWGMNLAANTPFEIDDIMKSMVGFKAIGIEVDKQFTNAKGQAKSFMEYVGDLASLRPDQGLPGVLAALRNGYGGNWRSFTQRMDINPKQILGHDMGKTQEEITKSIVELSDKLANGLMTKTNGTWTHIISNIKDQFTRLWLGIADGGAFDAAKATFAKLYTLLGSINSEEMSKIGASISAAFQMLWKPIDLVATGLLKVIMVLKDLVRDHPILGKIVLGITAFIGVATLGTGLFLKLTGGILSAIGSLGIMTIMFIQLRAQMDLSSIAIFRSLAVMRNFAVGMLGATAIIGAGIFAYQKNLFGFRDAVDDALSGITDRWKLVQAVIGQGGFTKDIKVAFGKESLDSLETFMGRVVMLGQVFGRLFGGDNGSAVSFSKKQYNLLKMLGIWDLTVMLVMAKARFEAFWKGVKEGFTVITAIGKSFLDIVMIPIKAIWEGLAKGLEKFIELTTGKKIDFLGMTQGSKDDISHWTTLGKIIGGVLAVLIGFKAARIGFSVLLSPLRAVNQSITNIGNNAMKTRLKLQTAFSGMFLKPITQVVNIVTTTTGGVQSAASRLVNSSYALTGLGVAGLMARQAVGGAIRNTWRNRVMTPLRAFNAQRILSGYTAGNMMGRMGRGFMNRTGLTALGQRISGSRLGTWASSATGRMGAIARRIGANPIMRGLGAFGGWVGSDIARVAGAVNRAVNPFAGALSRTNSAGQRMTRWQRMGNFAGTVAMAPIRAVGIAGRGIRGIGRGIGAMGRGVGRLGGAALGLMPYIGLGMMAGSALYNKLGKGADGKLSVNNIAPNLDKITKWMSKDGAGGMAAFWNKFIEAAKPIMKSLGALLKATFKALGVVLPPLLNQAWEGIKAGAKLAWIWIKTDGVKLLGEAWDWIKTDGVKYFGQFANYLLTDLFPDITLKIIDLLGKALKWLWTDGIPLLGKFLTYLVTDIVPALLKALGTGIKKVWDGIFGGKDSKSGGNTYTAPATIPLPSSTLVVPNNSSNSNNSSPKPFYTPNSKSNTNSFGVTILNNGGYQGTGAEPKANGGFANSPTFGVFGEAGPEVIIPLSGSRRGRGLDLWKQAGQMLGVKMAADGGIFGSSRVIPSKSPSRTPAANTVASNQGDVSLTIQNLHVNVPQPQSGTMTSQEARTNAQSIMKEFKKLLRENRLRGDSRISLEDMIMNA